MGEMYKLKAKYHDYANDDFIVMAELENLVALVNARTNRVEWLTKHGLKLDFELKTSTPIKPERKLQ